MSASAPKPMPPTEFAPCERIIIPQKLYYKKACFHTVCFEIDTLNAAIISSFEDTDVSSYVYKEMREQIKDLREVYTVQVNLDDHDTTKKQIQQVLGFVDTLVLVGSSKLFNEVAIALEGKEDKQLIVIITDAKPLAFTLGWYRNEEGKSVYRESLIPEMLCCDSGITTKNISLEDVKLVAEVAKVDTVSQWRQFIITAREITADLLANYETMDREIWKERATNVVGITMLGRPDGARVLDILKL